VWEWFEMVCVGIVRECAGTLNVGGCVGMGNLGVCGNALRECQTN
jgi:hypothetical protein